MEKSPPELVDRFVAFVDERLADEPGVTRRMMFGYPACFANGNLVTSLFEDRWIVRLAEDDLDELRTIGGTPFEPMAGRQMRGYLALPSDVLADEAQLEAWVRRALDHVRTLPPK